MLDKGLPHVVSLLSDMRKTRSSMPLFSTRLTAIVSVALVLLLLGVAAFLGIGARNVADDMRRDIGFVVIVADDASPADIAALKQRFAGAAYTSDYTYSSPEMVMQRWKTLMDDEGETDDLLDENPFAPEIEVNVRAPWANIDSLRAITTPLKLMPSVDDVKVHDTLVGEVNRTLSNIALILIIVAAVLLTISIVLINNTVRLTIYSRRFLIHTMKLVGATPGFIRAPMIRDNALGGLLAGFIADHCSDRDSRLLRRCRAVAFVGDSLDTGRMGSGRAAACRTAYMRHRRFRRDPALYQNYLRRTLQITTTYIIYGKKRT